MQELNAKGDQPQLSLLPRAVSNTVALMMQEAGERAARAAVRMMSLQQQIQVVSQLRLTTRSWRREAAQQQWTGSRECERPSESRIPLASLFS